MGGVYTNGDQFQRRLLIVESHIAKRLEEFEQLRRRHANLAQDGPQGSAVQLFVVRNRDGPQRIGAGQNDVTPFLSIELKPDPTQNLDQISTGNDGELAQMQTT